MPDKSFAALLQGGAGWYLNTTLVVAQKQISACVKQGFIDPQHLHLANTPRTHTLLEQAAQLDEIVALDRVSLGGLWSAEGYQREIDSPNSDLAGFAQN
ncbi:MAG: hypothetical protein HC787_07730 [Nostocaceae cyanobacterium CSU_2_110]|nr:hypothetical protein [Nostocaceae cyanobacterium CSU_2_110]